MGHTLAHLFLPLFRFCLQQVPGIRPVALQEKAFHRIPFPVQDFSQFPQFRRTAGEPMDQQHPFSPGPRPEIRFRSLEHGLPSFPIAKMALPCQAMPL